MSLFDGIKLLESLSEQEKVNFSLFCQEKYLSKGEIIFSEGDLGESMYLLVDGEIEVYKNNNGKEALLGKVFAEEILGEMAIFGESNKRMASARATTDCRLITVLAFSIKELTDKYPELLEKIKYIINDRILDNKIIEESIKN